MRSTRTGEVARTEAVRGRDSSTAISPTISPGPRRASGTSPVPERFTTSRSPEMTR